MHTYKDVVRHSYSNLHRSKVMSLTTEIKTLSNDSYLLRMARKLQSTQQKLNSKS